MANGLMEYDLVINNGKLVIPPDIISSSIGVKGEKIAAIATDLSGFPAKKTIDAFATILLQFPSGMPQMLVAVENSLGKPRQIVISGKKDWSETKALLREVHRHFLPNTIVILADANEGQKYLGERNEALRAMSPVEGKPAAYVCENFTCKAPVTDLKQLGDLLKL